MSGQRGALRLHGGDPEPGLPRPLPQPADVLVADQRGEGLQHDAALRALPDGEGVRHPGDIWWWVLLLRSTGKTPLARHKRCVCVSVSVCVSLCVCVCISLCVCVSVFRSQHLQPEPGVSERWHWDALQPDHGRPPAAAALVLRPRHQPAGLPHQIRGWVPKYVSSLYHTLFLYLCIPFVWVVTFIWTSVTGRIPAAAVWPHAGWLWFIIYWAFNIRSFTKILPTWAVTGQTESTARGKTSRLLGAASFQKVYLVNGVEWRKWRSAAVPPERFTDHGGDESPLGVLRPSCVQVRSHQKKPDFFRVTESHKKSQRTDRWGCDRQRVYSDAFTATRLQRRVYSDAFTAPRLQRCNFRP